MMRGYEFGMPDTLTYGWRKGAWVPTQHVGGDGILSLSQRPLKGGGSDLEVYAVEEQPADRPGCRVFLFVKLTDPEQEEPYKATVGAVSMCSCDAGRKGFRRTSCRHRDAVSALIVAGLLPARELAGA
jgi:hypothetical protein